MFNVGEIKLKKITDGRGSLTPVEGGRDIPFDIRRVYYLTDVDSGIERGKHCHKNLHQVLICVSGSLKVKADNTVQQEIFELNDSCNGLYIGPLVWREMYDFSENAVLLVFASEVYDESDYIRDYAEFEKKARMFFGN